MIFRFYPFNWIYWEEYKGDMLESIPDSEFDYIDKYYIKTQEF